MVAVLAHPFHSQSFTPPRIKNGSREDINRFLVTYAELSGLLRITDIWTIVTFIRTRSRDFKFAAE